METPPQRYVRRGFRKVNKIMNNHANRQYSEREMRFSIFSYTEDMDTAHFFENVSIERFSVYVVGMRGD